MCQQPFELGALLLIFIYRKIYKTNSVSIFNQISEKLKKFAEIMIKVDGIFLRNSDKIKNN